MMTMHGQLPALLRTRAATTVIAVWEASLGAASLLLLIVRPTIAATRYGLVLVAITYAALGGYVALVRRAHGEIECGCFGNAHRASRAAVARNLCFSLAAAAAIPMTSAQIGRYVLVAALAGGTTVCLAIVVARDLISASRRLRAS